MLVLTEFRELHKNEDSQGKQKNQEDPPENSQLLQYAAYVGCTFACVTQGGQPHQFTENLIIAGLTYSPAKAEKV